MYFLCKYSSSMALKQKDEVSRNSSANSTGHKETRLLSWFVLFKGAMKQENIRKLKIELSWYFFILKLISRIVNF